MLRYPLDFHPLVRTWIQSEDMDSAPVDLRRDDTGWTVDVLMPGFAKEQIDVRHEGNDLIVSATRDVAPQAGTPLYREIDRPKTVSRRIRLTRGADVAHASARYESGILQVTVPRTQDTHKEIARIAVS